MSCLRCKKECEGKYCSEECANISRQKQRDRERKRRAGMGRLVTELIHERDRGICQECWRLVDIELLGTNDPMAPSSDHIVPLSKGGTNTAANLQLTHRECNRVKGDSRKVNRIHRGG